MIDKLVSPVEQPLIWFAKNDNENILLEFEESGKENNFHSIRRGSLKEFGLSGKGKKLFFSTDNGIFHILGKTVEFYIKDSEEEYITVTGRSEQYTNILQYKEIHRDFNINTKEPIGKTIVDAFHFGYEHVININEKRKIIFSTIVRIPIGSSIKIGFVLIPNFDLNGNLFVSIGKAIDKTPIGISIKKNDHGLYQKELCQTCI